MLVLSGPHDKHLEKALWCVGPLSGSLAAGYAQGHSAVFFSRVDNAELLTVDQISWIGEREAIPVITFNLINYLLHGVSNR